MLWQRLVSELFRQSAKDFAEALRFGVDEPCDFIFEKYAVDTKYRIGSGDSGTLKKFKAYGALLGEKSYQPVFLILRTDNLPAALTAAKARGWQVHSGDDCFEFIKRHTSFDLARYLSQIKGAYKVER